MCEPFTTTTPDPDSRIDRVGRGYAVFYYSFFWIFLLVIAIGCLVTGDTAARIIGAVLTVGLLAVLPRLARAWRPRR